MCLRGVILYLIDYYKIIKWRGELDFYNLFKLWRVDLNEILNLGNECLMRV